MQIDPWILAFSAVTVIATIWLGFWSAKQSRTASDFFVAGRSVSVGWNASAISGEYLSAASFMGVAGMVMSSGYDALWYPVCYACGYLFLLLFIAGPLRRFGAYTIPDFAEGRFDSPVFRKIAVIFVLFIGFFYTMPQMKGAGTTLAYIFPGLPYWAGVVLVGAVITLNVALGGMKGITLVQAFQYWAKMFAISVPIFVLMAVYGHYGKQLGANGRAVAAPGATLSRGSPEAPGGFPGGRLPLPAKAPSDEAWLNPFGPLTTKAARAAAAALTNSPAKTIQLRPGLTPETKMTVNRSETNVGKALLVYSELTGRTLLPRNRSTLESVDAFFGGWLARQGWIKVTPKPDSGVFYHGDGLFSALEIKEHLEDLFQRNGIMIVPAGDDCFRSVARPPNSDPISTHIALRANASTDDRWTAKYQNADVKPVLEIYGELTGRKLLTTSVGWPEELNRVAGGQLKVWLFKLGLLKPQRPEPYELAARINYETSRPLTDLEMKSALEAVLATNNLTPIAIGDRYFQAIPTADWERTKTEMSRDREISQRRTERRLALLYTYSLIIALVCGTAGLPHILVRFYTNPDGVAAKRTTMWVMILIGVFYLFPPVFGVMGRNLMPDLYNGLSGVKGTDGVVLKLPRILNEQVGAREGEKAGGTNAAIALSLSPDPTVPAATTGQTERTRKIPWGSILSGITCAGAFAAFMSTFSGLLVSMTGALAHDVYGRILRPRSTPEQRMRMFRIGAVLLGGVAILLGTQVEKLEINFMVGQAFAIAAASYFPLLFVSVWWRGLTMTGAAAGMLTGGMLAVVAISLTSFTTLGWLKWDAFWAANPLLRILCDQPAIWAVPLAITLMVVISKLTRRDVPGDIRSKMLVLHAPEKLGLKQEYIQEHQPGH